MMRSSRAIATALEIRTCTNQSFSLKTNKQNTSEVVGLVYFLKSKGHEFPGRGLLGARGA